MKRFMLVISALATAVVAGPSLPAHADSYAHISNVAAPQQVLDAEAHGTAPGTRVLTYELHASSPDNQLWKLEPRPGATVAVVGKESGLCVAPTHANGAVQLVQCDPAHFSQRWYEETHPGNTQIYENALYQGQCLSFDNANSPAILTECDQSDTQLWRLIAQ